MPDIILHHYPQSPVSEKVRVVLGIKGLRWSSVIIPRIPPKPDVITLTGGYRRTPVMQIDADIYCDSSCIIAELERRCPAPTLFPENQPGRAQGIGAWIDGPLFDLTVAVVLGSEVENMPPEFAADRGRLYFGPAYDLRALNAQLPALVSQLRIQFGWVNDAIGAGPYMHGAVPGLIDALCYYPVWFIRGRFRDGPALLAQFPRLQGWESRLRELGHGDPIEMDSSAAVALANSTTSPTEPYLDPDDSLPLSVGDRVVVAPVFDGGDPSVTGSLIRLERERIAIRCRNERVGEVTVHFPRLNYRVELA